jgi:pimeloyl-ACP methyl ester carboxylesterase
MQRMKVIVEGLATEYRDEGEGPIILMLPGWLNSISNFDSLVSRLAGRYRIVRLDLPGFFREGTEMPPEAWGVQRYAQFVAAFVEKIGLTEYVLLGHSFGGRVTIQGVADGFLRPQKIILIASAGVAKTRTFRNRVFTSVAKLGKMFLYVPPFFFWRKELRRRLYKMLGSDYFAAGPMKDTYLTVIREDLQEHAKRIIVPALLVWGSEDRMTPLRDGKLFSSLISNARLEVLEGIGHSPHVDSADEVARLVQDFV